METKTLDYLNTKAWYRLLKVTYGFAFLLASLIAVLVMQDEHRQRTISDYRIVCNNEAKTTFFAYEDEGIYLMASDFRNGVESLSAQDISRLQAACGL